MCWASCISCSGLKRTGAGPSLRRRLRSPVRSVSCPSWPLSRGAPPQPPVRPQDQRPRPRWRLRGRALRRRSSLPALRSRFSSPSSPSTRHLRLRPGPLLRPPRRRGLPRLRSAGRRPAPVSLSSDGLAGFLWRFFSPSSAPSFGAGWRPRRASPIRPRSPSARTQCSGAREPPSAGRPKGTPRSSSMAFRSPARASALSSPPAPSPTGWSPAPRPESRSEPRLA